MCCLIAVFVCIEWDFDVRLLHADAVGLDAEDEYNGAQKVLWVERIESLL